MSVCVRKQPPRPKYLTTPDTSSDAQYNLDSSVDNEEENDDDEDKLVLWVPDSKVSACPACHKPFTVLRRRHHCRFCGGVFCYECSKHRVVPGGAERVRLCDKCALSQRVES